MVRQEHKEFGRKKYWGEETQRRQESYRKSTFSLCRLFKEASSKFSGSTDVVFPNSSTFIGSKNSPNLTKRKYEMKSYKENFTLVPKSFHSYIPLPFSSHSTYSAILLHLWQSREEPGSSPAAREGRGAHSVSLFRDVDSRYLLGTGEGQWC